MRTVVERLFGSKTEATWASLAHRDVAKVVSELWNLEEDWSKKVVLIQEFLKDWNQKWDLRKFEESIRSIRRIDSKEQEESKQRKKAILNLRNILQHSYFPISHSIRIKKLFEDEKSLLNRLEDNLGRQLQFIDYYRDKDIGVLRFNINKLIELLKEEKQILSLEEQDTKPLEELDAILKENLGREIAEKTYEARKKTLALLGFPFDSYPDLGEILVREWEYTTRLMKIYRDQFNKKKYYQNIKAYLLPNVINLDKIIRKFGLEDIVNSIFSVKDLKYSWNVDDFLKALKNLEELIMREGINKVCSELVEICNSSSVHSLYGVSKACELVNHFGLMVFIDLGKEVKNEFNRVFDTMRGLLFSSGMGRISEEEILKSMTLDMVRVIGTALAKTSYWDGNYYKSRITDAILFYETKTAEEYIQHVLLLAKIANENTNSELILGFCQKFVGMINKRNYEKILSQLRAIIQASGDNAEDIFKHGLNSCYLIINEENILQTGMQLNDLAKYSGRNYRLVLEHLNPEIIQQFGMLAHVEIAKIAGEDSLDIISYGLPACMETVRGGESIRTVTIFLVEIFKQAGNLLEFLKEHSDILTICITKFLSEIPEDKKTSNDLSKIARKIVSYTKIRDICARNFFYGTFGDAELQSLMGQLDMRILTTKFPADIKNLVKLAYDLKEEGYIKWYMMRNLNALKKLKSYGIKLSVWLGNQQLHLVQRVVAPGISNISPEEYKKRAINEQIVSFSDNLLLLFSEEMISNREERDKLFQNIANKTCSVLSVSKNEIINSETYLKVCSLNTDRVPDVINKCILPQVQDDNKMIRIVNPEKIQRFFGMRGDLEQIAESITKIIAGKTGEARILQLSFNVSKKYPLNLQLKTKWTRGMTHFFQPSVLTVGNDGGCCVAMGGVNEFAGFNFFLDGDALLINIMDDNKKRVGMMLAFASLENNQPILALNTVETPFRADSSIYPLFCDLCMQMFGAFAHVAGFHKIVIGKGYGSDYFQEAYPEIKISMQKMNPFKTDKKYYTNAFEGGQMQETPDGIVLSYSGDAHLIWEKAQGIMRNKLAADSIEYNREFKRAA